MKKSFFILLLALWCQLYPSFAQKTGKDLQITYIANEGFLLKSPSSKILIDALFSDGYGYFVTPPQEVANKMMDGKAPFDSISLYFLTHYHKDHCDAKMVREYLTKNPSMKLVTSRASLVFIDGCEFGFVKLKNQFCEMTPEPDQSLSQTINAIPIKAMGIHHMSFFQNGIDVEQYMFNLSFHIKMDGIKIFHSGDIKIENIKDYVAKNGKWTDGIDVAFLYYELLKDGNSDLEYIRKTLNPQYIVVTHVPPSANKEWSEKVEQMKKSFPNLLFFTDAMQSKTVNVLPVD